MFGDRPHAGVAQAALVPLSTPAILTASTNTSTNVARPERAHGLLMTADVDIMVQLAQSAAITASQGIFLAAGVLWPPMVVPASTGKVRTRAIATKGAVTAQWITLPTD